MKLICKDYYKYSRNIEIITLIRDGLSSDNLQRFWAVGDEYVLKSLLIRLIKDDDKMIRDWAVSKYKAAIK